MEYREDVSNNRHQPVKYGAKGKKFFIVCLLTGRVELL